MSTIPLLPAVERRRATAAGSSAKGEAAPDADFPEIEFLVGSENRLLASVVTALRCGAGNYNPLLLCGAAGTGKSRLAQGLAATWPLDENVPPSNARTSSIAHRASHIELTDGPKFCHDLAQLRGPRRLAAWRDRIRSKSLLVIDDVHLLGPHPAAQVELASTIDAICGNDGAFIATSRLRPAEIKLLSPALRSRLGAGLVVTIAPPEVPTRKALLRAGAERLRVKLPSDAIDVLAAGLPLPAGPLLAALDELVAARAGDFTALAAREYIARQRRGGTLKLSTVAGRVAKRRQLTVADLKGSSRRRSVAAACAVTMYLCRHLTGSSLKQIGDYLGGRDHTTVLHGCQVIDSQLPHDAALRADLAELRSELEGLRR
ncbi:MAG: AAA family ATPase, partial [Planctomycetia bacterium]|nr:AAA family ATPase [Planctomycetia bacterium]